MAKERQLVASGFIEGMAPDLMVLRKVGFRLLFGSGEPVSLDALSVETGWEINQLESILNRPDVAGRVQHDEDGNMVGIAGLSVEPTAHEVHLVGKQFWTWCALDAVGILSAMRSTGQVVSTTPGQNDPMSIEFVDGQAMTDHTIFILGEVDGTDLYDSWCPNVNFFVTAEDAETWASERGLAGEVAAVDRICEAAGAIWEPVVAGIGHG